MNRNVLFYSFKWFNRQKDEILYPILDRIAIQKMIGDPEILDRLKIYFRIGNEINNQRLMWTSSKYRQNPEISKSYNVKNTKNFLNWIINPETPRIN